MAAGDLIASIGSFLGLPEMGISEVYADGARKAVEANKTYSAPTGPVPQTLGADNDLNPNPAQPGEVLNTGPGSTLASTSVAPTAPTAPAKVIPDRSNSIAMQEAGLRGADEQFNTGMASIADKLASILGGYDSEVARNQERFNAETDTNKGNFQRNKWAALLNAAQGRRGLIGMLQSIGALSGTGIDLANRAVQQGANMDIAGANETFSENQTGLVRGMDDFTVADERRRKEAQEGAEGARIDLRNLVDTNRQKFYSNLADDYTQMEQFDKAKQYADLAASLFGSIGRTSAAAPALAPTQVPFTLPSLANYIGGAAGTQVTTTPASGSQQLPGLIALTPSQLRDRDDRRV